MEELRIFYFDVIHALREHDWLIDHSGGLKGNRDLGVLESALEHIHNDLYYPEFQDKLTHLVFAINKFHAFNDGNKRSSIVLGAFFLELNGYDYCVKKFIHEMENIAVWLAEGKINKDLLREIVTSIVMDDDYPEELKLKIIHAVGDEPQA
jgi:death-on-curing protein